jgi:hypothetical protein
MKKIFSLLVISLTIFSCSLKLETVRFVVASQTADCMGAFPQTCLLVKIGDNADWQFFYSHIEGFDYEEGYEYVLKVRIENRENTPADASSIRYILVKEVSKTRKVSENLPEPIKF